MILVPSRPAAYYGKVPARGDFVSRRLSRAVVDPWDDWLQLAIYTSREQLGGAWLDLYMVAPIWRFVLAGGLCGPAPLAGIMMPSVDTVGRNFPLLIAAELPAAAALGAVAGGGEAWFENAEAAALNSLRDGFRLEELDDAMVDLVGTEPAASMAGSARLSPPGLYLPLAPPIQPGPAYRSRFGAGGAHHSLWWTIGSERVPSVLAIVEGMPDPAAFASFLDGDWAGRGWAMTEAAAPGEPDLLAASPADRFEGPAGEDAPLPWDRDE